MLYNLSIQGPCLATNWTGKTEMAVMPMDKVFVVVVADLWHSRYNKSAANTISVLPQTPSTPLTQQIVQYLVPSGASASPFVLKQMLDLLGANGGFPGRPGVRPYANDEYVKFTYGSIMTQLREGVGLHAAAAERASLVILQRGPVCG